MDISKVLKKATKFIETTYNDELIILKDIIVENPDGSTDVVEGDQKEEKFKCKLSISKPDDSNVEEINKIHVEYKIFCDLKVNISEGDSIVVNKILDSVVKDTVKGIASKPSLYGLAQEIIIVQEEFA